MLFYYQSQVFRNRVGKPLRQIIEKALVFMIGRIYAFSFKWCFLVAVVGYIVKLRGNSPI